MNPSYKKNRQASFFSQEIKHFLSKRIKEAGGLGLLLFGLFLGLSLLSYSAQDASLNTKSLESISNMMGEQGAFFSDLFFQLFGFTSYFISFLMISWGLRIIIAHHLPHLKIRILSLPLLFLFLSIGLNEFPVFSDNWIASHPGGVLGSLFQNRLTLWTGLSEKIFSLVFGIIGVIFYYWLLAVPSTFKEFIKKSCKSQLDKVWQKLKSHIFKTPLSNPSSAEERAPAFLSSEVSEEINISNFPDSEPEPQPLKEKTSKAFPLLKTVTPSENAYGLPPLDLLQPDTASKTPQIPKQLLEENAQRLLVTLQDFGIQGEIKKFYPGPVVTLYEFEPAPGVKSSRIIGLADDIARSMSAISTRIAVIPGYNAIGIELPNPQRQTVYMRTLLEGQNYQNNHAKLPLILGKNISGDPVIADLGKMPHLLIAGTTGSGKSVSINTMILSLLYKLSPDHCKFIMIDPKMLELSVYDGIPHLLSPVVTDPHKAVMALKWAVREMESRYQAMSKLGVRNIEGYNQRIIEAKARNETLTRRVQTGFHPETGESLYEDQTLELKVLPFIVILVDEMADLMLVAGKDIESSVQRLAQMARAAGIHLIMATQRPSVDVITGTIKANFPTRISFHVTSKIDSRTILGEQGAEQLLGQGDMLYMVPGGRITRVHGPFASDQEVERVVQFLKAQGEPDYENSIVEEEAGPAQGSSYGNDEVGDALYTQALNLVLTERKASTSFIQRHLQIGYNRAARIMERMEDEGVVSKANHVGKREIL